MTAQQGQRYGTPAAFRRALTDKLRVMAAADPNWSLTQLQRQFAYDRLIVRLYLLDDGWVLKGSTALLARHIAVRHTIDVDVYRATTREMAELDLRVALALDGGDWFTFEAGPARTIADGASGIRIPVNARIGTTTWSKFHVDVVAEGVVMTGEPDTVPALTAVSMPGLPQPSYRAYPLHDHIADKTCAILERQGVAQSPSTRFKDLVDLVVLVDHAETTASEQYKALASEAKRRNLVLPRRFDVPDADLWRDGYAAEARRSVLAIAPTLPKALEKVTPYLNPLLEHTATGTWHPGRAHWA